MRGRGPHPGNRQLDSNGPEGRIRGTAQQIYERYLVLARDSQASGDSVVAESLLQHAEHYFRLMSLQGQNPYQARAREDEGRDDADMGDGEEQGEAPRERQPAHAGGYDDGDRRERDRDRDRHAPRGQDGHGGHQPRGEGRQESRGEPRAEQRAEPRAEPRHEPVRAETARPEPSRSEPARAEPTIPGLGEQPYVDLPSFLARPARQGRSESGEGEAPAQGADAETPAGERPARAPRRRFRRDRSEASGKEDAAPRQDGNGSYAPPTPGEPAQG